MRVPSLRSVCCEPLNTQRQLYNSNVTLLRQAPQSTTWNCHEGLSRNSRRENVEDSVHTTYLKPAYKHVWSSRIPFSLESGLLRCVPRHSLCQLSNSNCSHTRLTAYTTSSRRPCTQHRYSTSVVPESESPDYIPSTIPNAVVRKRSFTLRRLSKLIKSKFGEKYSVELFGSTCYGTDTARSDLDVVIIDPDRPNGFMPQIMKGRLPEIYDIGCLGRRLRSGGFTDVTWIPTAVVPIVKFSDPVTGLSCDVNVNDRLGLVNTHLIQRYCELSPVLRSMIWALKNWARPRGLNNPAAESGILTFSSYTLALMAIGLMQIRGWLPNLQADVDKLGGGDDGLFWIRRRASLAKQDKRMCYYKCDIRYSLGEDWTPSDTVTLREALMAWFRYWADEHQYGSDSMSVRHGGKIPRQEILSQYYPPSVLSTMDIPALRYDFAANVTHDSAPNKTMVGDGTGSIDVELEGNNGDVHAPLIKDDLRPPEAGDQDSNTALRALGDILKWMNPPLCVGDPFIDLKNLCANISHKSLQTFRSECRNAFALLEQEIAITELFSTGQRSGSRSTKTSKQRLDGPQ